jgi:hypothetical protein
MFSDNLVWLSVWKRTGDHSCFVVRVVYKESHEECVVDQEGGRRGGKGGGTGRGCGK